jgi:hypothetical protein
LDALAAHGIPRDKIFSEKISTRVRVRPQFEAALALARQIRAHAPHCRVIFTVNEMKRLGRDAAELTALADHLTAHGLVMEMPAARHLRPVRPGPDPDRVFRRDGRNRTREHPRGHPRRPRRRRRKDKHGGRPAVITADMLHTVLRRRAVGETVEQIRPDLIIPTGKRKGHNPSLASIYRALATHEKTSAYPDAVEQAAPSMLSAPAATCQPSCGPARVGTMAPTRR